MKSTFWIHRRSWMALPLVVLTGCAVVPPGPSVAVMPGPGKSFEQFGVEEQVCRNYAEQSTGMAPAQASNNAVAGSAVVGGLLGAAAGAAMGGHHSGAAAGAGFGVLAGTSMGVAQGAQSAAGLQRRYDIAYEQCMYAKGNQLPQASYRQSSRAMSSQRYYAPPPPQYAPPPQYGQQPQYAPQPQYLPPPQ